MAEQALKIISGTVLKLIIDTTQPRSNLNQLVAGSAYPELGEEVCPERATCHELGRRKSNQILSFSMRIFF